MKRWPEASSENVPKLLVWQLSSPDGNMFTTQECMLTIESIAALAKPIVVLTGPGLLGRPDLYQIVEYGFALGLKMIVEAEPEQLNDGLLRAYAHFGRRVFRVIVDGRILADPARRFRDTPELRVLDACLANLRRHGYEVHLSLSLHDTNPRPLTHCHDYALQRAARGLFCHLDLSEEEASEGERAVEIDRLLGLISSIKNSIGGPMYFSPQCVTYRPRAQNAPGGSDQGLRPPSREGSWDITCAAGRSYAMITADGLVHPCRNTPEVCGNLREAKYNFAEIWNSAPAFLTLRGRELNCGDVRSALIPVKSLSNGSL